MAQTRLLLLQLCVISSGTNSRIIPSLFTLQPGLIPASLTSCCHFAVFRALPQLLCLCQRANTVSAHSAKPPCLFNFTTLCWISEVRVCVCVWSDIPRCICFAPLASKIRWSACCAETWHTHTLTKLCLFLSSP